MEGCCVHHVEFGVRNGDTFKRKFINQYNFRLVATRENSPLKQWVLKSERATVLVSELKDGNEIASVQSDPYFVPWNTFLCVEGLSEIKKTCLSFDSVHNVALKVKDIVSCVDRLTKSGGLVLKEPKVHTDTHGEVKVAVVKSCIGNVIHTLIECDGYSGIFLPGFKCVDNVIKTDFQKPVLFSHIDHVTYACNCGDSNAVLEWYEKCFGMKRFLINREESVEDGFLVDEKDIGVRLKAFEYWKCAEKGLYTAGAKDSIKFVIAEALPGQGPNQIDTFLCDHNGPGIQHVGLHTSDMINTVASLMESGVEFAEPPYTYYTEVGKLEEIQEIQQDLAVMKKHGILVDTEADPYEENEMEQQTCPRYLMQKFTKPLFERNTFFLEVIQRMGARGFGSGNITALWRSVQAYLNKNQTNS